LASLHGSQPALGAYPFISFKKGGVVMKIVALILGILAILGMIVGFFPCVGWYNWINIPFAFLGLIICIIALVSAKEKSGAAIAGLVMCALAGVFGLVRLVFGGGVL
jgi:hypothetical protein